MDMLRPYQQWAKTAVMQAWATHRNVMLQMPTGTGKTRLFVSVIADLQKRNPRLRVLIVTHRRELVEQVSRSLTVHGGLKHGILSGKLSANLTEPVMVASVQTLRGRRAEGVTADYIIIDEAHHSLAPSWQALWHRFPDARKLGVTATPYRLKKKPFTSLYEVLLESLSMKEFIAQGYLADYVLYTASAKRTALARINRLTKFGADGDYRQEDLDTIYNVEEETAWLYDCYRNYAAGRKGIVYAVNCGHAARIARYFVEKGVTAASIDSGTSAGEREARLEQFRRGELKVLVNVELFTEGFDCPSIGFVMLARPTRSLALYLQQVGRALRPSPDGGKVLLLDTVGLQARFGLPDRKRDWQAHFRGETPPREKYNLPLGNTVGASAALLTEIPRETVYTEMKRTLQGWCIASVYKRQFLLDEHQNRLLKGFDLENIRLLGDGNYSGTIRRTGEMSLDYAFRFTPDLQLIPTDTQRMAGLTVYRHVYSRLTDAILTGDDAFWRKNIPDWGEWPFFTLCTDLRKPDFFFFQEVEEMEGGEWVWLDCSLTNRAWYPRMFFFQNREYRVYKSGGRTYPVWNGQILSPDGKILGRLSCEPVI